MDNAIERIQTRCCVVGGGPAGMMLGLLLARAGIETVVLEKHGDFLRDFRGDTVHPSTLEILDELGLKERFDALPQHREKQLQGLFADGMRPLIDFRRLRPFPYMALVPQWDLLNLLAEAAQESPAFTLRMRSEVTDVTREAGTGRVVGVTATTPQGVLEVRADLVVGCDGRHSVLRRAAGLVPLELGAPMDVLWFQLARHEADTNATFGVPGYGSFLVVLNRNEYWQVASVIPKGDAAQWRSRPIEEFHSHIAQRVATLADKVEALRSWDQIKLLEVRVERLEQWHRPGLLLIGDAAHAMSPIGGVGINLAIQDAVAAANILTGPLREPGPIGDEVLAAVQERRMLPTKITQGIQLFLQRRLIAPALARQADTALVTLPAAARLLLHSSFLRSLPAHAFGQGFRREHVRTL